MIPPAQPVPGKADVIRRIGGLLAAEARLRLREQRARGATGSSRLGSSRLGSSRLPLDGVVPRRPDQLTADWLTEALQETHPGARVLAMSPPGRPSSGTTSRAAFTVEYASPDPALPRHLFVKCTSSLAQRLMLGMGGLISGEPGFYAHIRPKLEIEAPLGYFGTVDPSSWRSVVVMEDVVASRGARFWAPGTPVTRSQVEDLLANAAAWHGKLWQSPALESWRWLRTPADQGRLIDSLIALADRTPAGARRAAAVIPPSLKNRQRDLFQGMRRSLQAAGRKPHTYLHGDLHIANTYLTRDARMGVCDWQVGLRGSWAYDVAYLLTTALEIDDRRRWERELLAFYLERLAACGGTSPKLPEAWLAYRQSTFYPYFAWVYTLGRSRLQPRFQPAEVALRMIERIAMAIEDLESLGAVGL